MLGLDCSITKLTALKESYNFWLLVVIPWGLSEGSENVSPLSSTVRFVTLGHSDMGKSKRLQLTRRLDILYLGVPVAKNNQSLKNTDTYLREAK